MKTATTKINIKNNKQQKSTIIMMHVLYTVNTILRTFFILKRLLLITSKNDVKHIIDIIREKKDTHLNCPCLLL